VNKELIINSTAHGTEIALLEDKNLVELHYDTTNADYAVGDLYLGKVKKMMPGLNAVFVDIGHEKDAFLHYSDLSPKFKTLLKFTNECINTTNANGVDYANLENEAEIVKTGLINQVITGKPNILVQVLKEPISSKGPRISCELSLPGRFIVITPFSDFVSVSKKIVSNDERKRLQRIIESIKPKNFGVIVRTAAEAQSSAELHKDLLELTTSWKAIMANLKNATAPSKILSEKSKTTSILRDLLSPDFNGIIANDLDIVNDAKEFLKRIAPEKINIIQHHQNNIPIFDNYGISKQVKGSFGKTVLMSNGGYLIIERTEALHVIDVNSGSKFGSDNQEDNGMQTNMVAAREVARQIRLRDLGGIIVVDFIDMKNPDNKRILQAEIEKCMDTDRAKHTILPMSKFGLIQITRQRLRPEVTISTGESCPACQGTGKVRSTEVLMDDIENKLEYLVKHNSKNLELHVHSIVYSHVTKGKGLLGLNNILKDWNKKLGIKLKVVEEPHFELINYAIHDGNTGEEIKI
jgi:ribonuclease G